MGKLYSGSLAGPLALLVSLANVLELLAEKEREKEEEEARESDVSFPY